MSELRTFVNYGSKDHPAPIVESYAMNAIDMPPLLYKSNLPEQILNSGDLSDLQLEAIDYAGQRHCQPVDCEVPPYIYANEPALGNSVKCRGGFFLGDGTGVGKGRTIAGIIEDNRRQGIKRAIWFSVSKDLIEDARRDIEGIGANIKTVRLNDYAIDKKIDLKEGIIFCTYSTLISERKTKQTPGMQSENKITRLNQLINWLKETNEEGEGVIVFDECHKLKNFIPDGAGEPTLTGKAGVKLQIKLPNCKVVYSSATGATDIRNMGYMARLGLWGPGTSFPEGFIQFMNEIDKGGIGAMEMVCRDMKALGMYVSRNLSYEGVEYHECYHELTPEQREMYDKLAGLWQFVFRNIDNALDITNADPRTRRTAYQNFWSNHQRFFSQLITALKVPTTIREIEGWLEKDHSVVISLINTFEARTADKVAKVIAEERSLEEIDITPREIIFNLIENCFPVELYEEVDDPHNEGNTIMRQVLGEDDEPMCSREALRMKEELLDEVDRFHVPENPLDQIVNYFGTDNVAEVTGRKKRLIKDSETGKVEYKKRAPEGVSMDKVNLYEMNAFQSGKKRIAIISDAASTGISLHSDKTALNQQRRVQITMQVGWSADKQLQTFGRTHRSNQVSPPVYILVVTDVAGERRFASTIAKRLASLGALTKGQADTTGNNNLAKYNFETKEGKATLKKFYEEIETQDFEVPGLEDPYAALCDMQIIKEDKDGKQFIPKEDYLNVTRFLNRLLSLDIYRQNCLFEKYMNMFDEIVQRAKDEGTYDEGVTDLKAETVSFKQDPEILYTHSITRANTFYYHLEIEEKINKISWEDILKTYENYAQASHRFSAFMIQRRSLNPAFIYQVESGSDPVTGQERKRYIKATPRSKEICYDDELEKHDVMELSYAKAVWQKKYLEVPEYAKKDIHIVGGSILHVWHKLKDLKGDDERKLKIIRTEIDNKIRIVGVEIPPSKVLELMEHFGAKSADSEIPPDEIYRRVANGETIPLPGNTTMYLRRVKYMEKYMIELIGVEKYMQNRFRDLGFEKIRDEGTVRIMLYADEYAIDIIAKVIDIYKPKEYKLEDLIEFEKLQTPAIQPEPEIEETPEETEPDHEEEPQHKIDVYYGSKQQKLIKEGQETLF